MRRLSPKEKHPSKTPLIIQTPSAGVVRIVPDYLELKGCVLLQYLNETTTEQRTAAALYLLDEGFFELAHGKIAAERL